MKRFMLVMASCAVCSVAMAQVGTTASEGAKATSQKAQQYGDQAKAAISS